MWLLDHNLPSKLAATLAEYGIKSANTYRCGWAELRNGDLVAAAFAAGYRVMLTRDVLFGESAAKALSQHVEMAVVLILLPQERGSSYLAAFRAAWAKAAIVPQPGRFTHWGG